MTENEAKLILDVRISKFDHADDVNMALEIAKNAIKEIQQYRAIGTVEECRKARKNQREEKSVVFRLKKLIDYYSKLMEDTKDLMDYVNDHSDNYPCEYNLADTEEGKYKILCEVIGDLRKEADDSDQNGINDGWIPCSQRLPLVPEGIDDQKFIVTTNGIDEPTALNCDSHGTWYDDDGNIYDVIAWQLLPEPYIR